MSHEAIRLSHPNVVTINGELPDIQAWDQDGNEVTLDLSLIPDAQKIVDAENAAKQQAILDAKQALIDKLMALGLTEEEALALGVK